MERLYEMVEDKELFAEHARAYERLRRADPDRLAAIEDEDREWERSGLREGPRTTRASRENRIVT